MHYFYTFTRLDKFGEKKKKRKERKSNSYLFRKEGKEKKRKRDKEIRVFLNFRKIDTLKKWSI